MDVVLELFGWAMTDESVADRRYRDIINAFASFRQEVMKKLDEHTELDDYRQGEMLRLLSAMDRQIEALRSGSSFPPSSEIQSADDTFDLDEYASKSGTYHLPPDILVRAMSRPNALAKVMAMQERHQKLVRDAKPVRWFRGVLKHGAKRYASHAITAILTGGTIYLFKLLWELIHRLP